MASFSPIFGHLLFGSGRRRCDAEAIFDRLRRSNRFRALGEANLEDRLQRLEETVAEEALLYQALFRACKDHGLIKGPEFLSLLGKVDLLDGVADGRLSRNRPGKKPAGGKAAP